MTIITDEHNLVNNLLNIIVDLVNKIHLINIIIRT